MNTIALIVAGGSGIRIGGDTPKQYLKIGNSTIIAETIKKFLGTTDDVDGVFCVIKEENEKFFLDALKGSNLKILGYTFGGENRQQSVLNGLEELAKYNPKNVLIHDSVRPFVSHEIIKDVVNCLKMYDAVVPVVKIVDTIKKVNGEKIIEGTIDRSALYAVQTPQGFKFSKILELHRKYAGKEGLFTDDASLFEYKGLDVHTVEGGKSNFKITEPEDYEFAKMEHAKMFGFSDIRVGNGFDAHRFSDENVGNKNNKVFFGGVTIPSEKNIEAHSDGDVLIHSLVDALLGAISEGDIGQYFPPSDKKWKNASSKIFLEFANSRVNERGYRINNIDITVICEKPRMSSYKSEIRRSLAEILNIAVERINVKGTTTEKMGFTGRGEGIAVQSVCCLTR